MKRIFAVAVMMFATLLLGQTALAGKGDVGSIWQRLDFDARVKLSGELKFAREANRIARQEFGGRVGGWASIRIKNQSYQSSERDLWITISPISQNGWYRRWWEKESFRMTLPPGGEFIWQRGRFGHAYMVTVRELDVYGSRWEVVYESAHVPTRETYGYTLVVPGREETDWERDQRALQGQLNTLLVQRAVRQYKDLELDAQIEALRSWISQNQKG